MHKEDECTCLPMHNTSEVEQHNWCYSWSKKLFEHWNMLILSSCRVVQGRCPNTLQGCFADQKCAIDAKIAFIDCEAEDRACVV